MTGGYYDNIIMITFTVPVYRMAIVRIIFKELLEDTLVRESTSNRKGVSYCSPLWFTIESYNLSQIMKETYEMKPVLIRMYLSDPLSCLEGVYRIG